jgi:predicted glycosyltransferase
VRALMVEMLDELLIPYASIPKNVHPINVLNEIHKREAHLSKIFQKNHPMHSS